MAGRKWKRLYRPPAETGGTLFGTGDGVPALVPALCPAFLPVFASLSPKILRGRKWTGGEERVSKKGFTLAFRNRAAVRLLGPFSVKVLLLAYAAFTARPHGLTKGKISDEALSFSVPVWEAAMLLGVAETVDPPRGKDGEIGGEAYARIAARLRDFEDRVRESLRLLSSVSVLSGGEAVSLLLKASAVRSGEIGFCLSPEMGVALAKSGTTFVPTALLRLDGKERAAFGLGVKISAHFSIRKNYRRGRIPDRLRVSSLLESTPLPTVGDVGEAGNPLRRGWRTAALHPFEGAMGRLKTGGVLSSWEYASGKKGKDFPAPEKWAAEKVVFALSDPPKIEPPKWRKRNPKTKPKGGPDEAV